MQQRYSFKITITSGVPLCTFLGSDETQGAKVSYQQYEEYVGFIHFFHKNQKQSGYLPRELDMVVKLL